MKKHKIFMILLVLALIAVTAGLLCRTPLIPVMYLMGVMAYLRTRKLVDSTQSLKDKEEDFKNDYQSKQ